MDERLARAAQVRTELIRVGPQLLETAVIGPEQALADGFVLLHEGLGSIALWRDFPAALHRVTGRTVLAWSRDGHGWSSGTADAFEPDFMHRQAEQALPALLGHFGIERPILLGHSDGASIALIYAGAHPTTRAVIALAPHLFVEPICIEAITALAAKAERDRLVERMARYHRDPALAWRRWMMIWLDPRFRSFNIEAQCAAIGCPVLAIQGEDDQYGTLAQIHRLAELAPHARAVALPACRHSPHLEARDATLAEIDAFIRGI